MTKRPRALLLILPPILAILVSRCAAAHRPVTVSPVPERPTGFTAEYRLTWTDGRRARSARLAVAYRAPQRMRLEVLDPLGASRAVLSATEAGAILLDPVGREFRAYGEAPNAVRDLAGFSLDADLLAALLLGDPARAPQLACRAGGEGSGLEKVCEGSGGDPFVRLRGDGMTWEIAPPAGPLLRIEMEAAGGSAGGVPERIRVRGGSPEVTVELRLRELRFVEPPEDLFSLLPPASFRDSSEDPPRPVFW